MTPEGETKMIAILEGVAAGQKSQGERLNELHEVVVGKPTTIHKGLVSRMNTNEAEVRYVKGKLKRMDEQRAWYSRKVIGTLIAAAVAVIATMFRTR